MGVGEFEAQQRAEVNGNYTPGYPTSTPLQEAGPPPQQGYPTKPAAAETYQTQPQAYHEEFTRAPPQYQQGYPPQPPPQAVYVQHTTHNSDQIARGCCWGCLAALCCCLLL